MTDQPGMAAALHLGRTTALQWQQWLRFTVPAWEYGLTDAEAIALGEEVLSPWHALRFLDMASAASISEWAQGRG